jgi:hypothetical protein
LSPAPISIEARRIPYLIMAGIDQTTASKARW